MSIAVSLVEILKANGNTPVAPADMKDKINFPTKSIHNSCLAMVKQGIFEKLDDGRFKLVEGISEEKLKEVLKIPDPDLSNEGNNDEEGGGKGGKDGGVKKDLTSIKATAKTEFEDLLKSVGVDKNVVPTISKLFFDGDTDSLPWLREVLTRHASGFIAAKELRLVLAAYAKSHNLPATEIDLEDETPEGGKGGKNKGPEGTKNVGKEMADKLGIGYKIAKDKDGDWVPVAGGPLTYEAALESAERANYIKAVGRGQPPEEGTDPDDTGTGKPTGRALKPAMSFQEKFMDKLLDNVFDKNKGGDITENPAFQALQRTNDQLANQLAQMKEDQDRQWRERMEANMAAILSRDPLGDPAEVARLKQILGVNNNAVTENSPVVQLIKDQGNRMDKTADRLAGIFERVALNPDSLKLESKSTPEEKEKRAGDLLNQATNKDRSAAIRKAAFGV